MSIEKKAGRGPFMTIPQAAQELGVPVSTLRRAVNAGAARPF